MRWEDGPWIPGSVTIGEVTDAPWDRDGMHSGVGGLAHVLAEIRLARPWTMEEGSLADAIADRIRGAIPAQTDCTYFDGLVSAVGVLTALEVPGTETAVARLAALGTPDGWPQSALGLASSPMLGSSTSPSARRASCSQRFGPDDWGSRRPGAG